MRGDAKGVLSASRAGQIPLFLFTWQVITGAGQD